MASRAERLVPTNNNVPPSASRLLTKLAASVYMGCVFSRLIMWILLRSPKMKGDIFGFQKRVWCPKWTPASSICRMDTPDMDTPGWVKPPRIPTAIPERPGSKARKLQEHPAAGLSIRVWGSLPKKAALYTMNLPSEQCLTHAHRAVTVCNARHD